MAFDSALRMFSNRFGLVFYYIHWAKDINSFHIARLMPWKDLYIPWFLPSLAILIRHLKFFKRCLLRHMQRVYSWLLWRKGTRVTLLLVVALQILRQRALVPRIIRSLLLDAIFIESLLDVPSGWWVDLGKLKACHLRGWVATLDDLKYSKVQGLLFRNNPVLDSVIISLYYWKVKPGRRFA